MQVFWFLVFGCLSVTAIDVVDQQETRIDGQNGWYVPNQQGSLKWVSSKAFEALEKLDKLTKKLNSITFFLYTNTRVLGTRLSANPTRQEILDAGFNPEHLIVFSVHGFLQNKYSLNMNRDVKNAYFEKTNVNYVYVQWLSADVPSYIHACNMVPTVGAAVAQFYENLRRNFNIRSEDTHFIGHSLGAHVVGYAAKLSEYKFSYISALDAAKPLFPYDKPNDRLNSTDALYVEAIHTDGDIFGHSHPIGSTDFYANGGKKQPGCIEDICHHERSVALQVDAIRYNNFPSYKCNDYQSVLDRKCDNQYSDVRMGDHKNRFGVSGIYYVETKNESPFGMLKV